MELKEQLSGVGEVYRNDENLGEVNYNLYVYQNIISSGGERIEGLTETKGENNSEQALKLFKEENLILKLEDGRHVEFFVVNTNGEIACSGEFNKTDLIEDGRNDS